MKDVFLLDADETLLDFCKAERESLVQTLYDHGLPVSDEVCARYHEINDSLWKALERKEITRERLVVKRFELLFEEYGYTADCNAVAEDFFEGISLRGYLFEGAEAFLRRLKERGRVYIVTNGAVYTQKRRFARSGIDALCDGVFISEEIGVYKPSKGYAEYVEAHIPDYQRNRAVWLGDGLTSDMACAETVGIDFVLYAPQGAPSDYRGKSVRSYEEFIKLIEALP